MHLRVLPEHIVLLAFAKLMSLKQHVFLKNKTKIAMSIKKGLLILMSQHLVNILWKLVMPFCLLVGLQCQFAAITNGKN